MALHQFFPSFQAVSLSVTVLPVTTDGNIDVLGTPDGSVT